jgi:ETC complex I subunit conserved region
VVALIYQPARSAMTSGKARTRGWKLRFEPRSPRYVEPLMGWTGNDDTLSQVELAFPSAEAAVGYARRQGLQYVVHGLADIGANSRHIADRKPPAANAASARWRWPLESVERTLGPETIRNCTAGNDPPRTRYAAPKDVLRDASLSEAQKRDVLRGSALDAYLIESMKDNAVPGSSNLDQVIDALIDLDEPELRHLAARASRSTDKAHSEAA